MRRLAFNTTSARLAAFAALAAVCGWASAANVVLKDGTVIHGEVESLQGGVYTVRTDSLGTVQVPKSQVRTIDESGAPSRPPPPSSAAPSPQPAAGAGIAAGLLQDPQLLEQVQALQDDPDVRAVLADPKIMSEIAAGDYAALMNDPKIVALMNNEKLKALLDEVR